MFPMNMALWGPDFDNIVVEHGRARVDLPLNDVSFFKNGLGWDAKAFFYQSTIISTIQRKYQWHMI